MALHLLFCDYIIIYIWKQFCLGLSQYMEIYLMMTCEVSMTI